MRRIGWANIFFEILGIFAYPILRLVFCWDRILPILELLEEVEPKTLSFVIPDLRTRRLARLKKRDIRGVPKDCGRPISVRLQAKFRHVERPAALGEFSQKAVRGHNNNKLGSQCATFRSSSMEMSSPLILSAYGCVEEVLLARLAARTAHGNYIIKYVPK